MLTIGSLAAIVESAKKNKLSKTDKMIKQDYERFKAHNSQYAKSFGLDKLDLADSKGLTGKGGAIAGAVGGAIGGIPGGPAGMLAGSIGGAVGGAAGTKFRRYNIYKTYGKFDKKNDPDW